MFRAFVIVAMKKGPIAGRLRVWVEARQRYQLSHAHIQMARELGMNPKKFGKLANQRQEPWKAPLPEFIERLYFKRFGKLRPDRVISLEERAKGMQRKKERRKVAREVSGLPSLQDDPTDESD